MSPRAASQAKGTRLVYSHAIAAVAIQLEPAS